MPTVTILLHKPRGLRASGLRGQQSMAKKKTVLQLILIQKWVALLSLQLHEHHVTWCSHTLHFRSVGWEHEKNRWEGQHARMPFLILISYFFLISHPPLPRFYFRWKFPLKEGHFYVCFITKEQGNMMADKIKTLFERYRLRSWRETRILTTRERNSASYAGYLNECSRSIKLNVFVRIIHENSSEICSWWKETHSLQAGLKH